MFKRGIRLRRAVNMSKTHWGINMTGQCAAVFVCKQSENLKCQWDTLMKKNDLENKIFAQLKQWQCLTQSAYYFP